MQTTGATKCGQARMHLGVMQPEGGRNCSVEGVAARLHADGRFAHGLQLIGQVPAAPLEPVGRTALSQAPAI